MNVYIIWETNIETKEETFVNVVFNLKEAKDWLKTAIDYWGFKYTYSLSKHSRGTDSFGWREWKKHAIVEHEKVILF